MGYRQHEKMVMLTGRHFRAVKQKSGRGVVLRYNIRQRYIITFAGICWEQGLQSGAEDAQPLWVWVQASELGSDLVHVPLDDLPLVFLGAGHFGGSISAAPPGELRFG